MTVCDAERIHPSSIISPSSELEDTVRVGPHAVIEGEVRLGAGTVIHPFVHLIGPLVMGTGNEVHSGAVLGEVPQHSGYRGEKTWLEIGDHNVFHEHVTIHRAVCENGKTRIGSGNTFLPASHVGHDCLVGDGCVLRSRALIGGHCLLGDGCEIGSNAGVHQHCRIGRLAVIGDVACCTKDIPPFLSTIGINCAHRVNDGGLRKAGVSAETLHIIRRAYHLLLTEGLPTTRALGRIEQQLGACPEVQEIVRFIQESVRGVSLRHSDAFVADHVEAP